jgi:hypothetical protein
VALARTAAAAELAFILSYQGLALIQPARRTGPEAQDHAIGRFTEAQELFRRITITAFVWPTGFYRALGDIEAARWPGTGQETRDQRQARARRLMEESSALIDRLRESSEGGDAARERTARPHPADRAAAATIPLGASA